MPTFDFVGEFMQYLIALLGFGDYMARKNCLFYAVDIVFMKVVWYPISTFSVQVISGW